LFMTRLHFATLPPPPQTARIRDYLYTTHLKNLKKPAMAHPNPASPSDSSATEGHPITELAGWLSLGAEGVVKFNDYRRSTGYTPIDFQGVDLAGTDLSGANLSDVSFQQCRFAYASLISVVGIYAQFIACDLTEADFFQASLEEAVFDQSLLTGANFSGATLTAARFKQVEAPQTCWDDADCREATFEEALLRDASFVSAQLEGAKFTNANMSWANVSGTTSDEHTVWGYEEPLDEVEILDEDPADL